MLPPNYSDLQKNKISYITPRAAVLREIMKKYVLAVLVCLLCTFLTAVGSAVPAIIGMDTQQSLAVTAAVIKYVR